MANNDTIKALFELLLEDNGANKIDPEKVAEEKVKREEAEKQKAEEAEAAAKKKAEEERKAEEARKSDDELEKLKLKDIQRDVKAGLKDKDLDDEYFENLNEFVAYDRMKDEDGNADPEKVEKLVNALTSIALRTPPSGGAVDYDPNNQGLGKYLK